jgi:hypothetical protein
MHNRLKLDVPALAHSSNRDRTHVLHSPRHNLDPPRPHCEVGSRTNDI